MTSIFCVTNATSFYFLSSNSFLAVWNCEFDRDPRFVVLIIFYINSSCIMLAFFKRIITSPALLIYLCVFRFTHFLHTLHCKLRIIHFLFVRLWMNELCVSLSVLHLVNERMVSIEHESFAAIFCVKSARVWMKWNKINKQTNKQTIEQNKN